MSPLIEAPSILGPVRTMPGATFVPTKQEPASLVLREGPGWESPSAPAGLQLYDPREGLELGREVRYREEGLGNPTQIHPGHQLWPPLKVKTESILTSSVTVEK